jgi:hypothetical protein
MSNLGLQTGSGPSVGRFTRPLAPLLRFMGGRQQSYRPDRPWWAAPWPPPGRPLEGNPEERTVLRMAANPGVRRRGCYLARRARLAWLLLGLSCGLAGCGRPPVLGPSDSPDFARKQWVTMDITYRVRRPGGTREEHRARVTDSAAIRQALGSMSVRRISGSAVAGPRQIRLVTAEGEVWLACVVFENRIDFSLEQDRWRSYTVITGTDRFYRWLLSVCLANEREAYPYAETAHIILRWNSDVDSYPVLSPPDGAGATAGDPGEGR